MGKRQTKKDSYEISTDAAPDDTCDVENLRKSVEFVEGALHRIRDAIAEEYFELYSGWGSPLGALTKEQFKAIPILVSLEADEVGVELYFDDGGLFLDHVFSLRIRDGQVTRISLEG